MINKINQRSDVVYFHGLNGLRAIAALIVFLSHAIGFYNVDLLSKFLIFDGAAAVILFFILSGFFLSIKYVSDKNVRIEPLSYLIKRFFRLYPPYFAGLIVTLFLRYFIFQPGNMVGLSDWVNSKWLSLPNLKEIVRFSLLIGATSSLINSTMWVMYFLILMSIIFPVVIILLRKINSPIGIVIFLVVTYALAFKITHFQYLPFFVLGGVVAKYYQKVHELISKRHLSKLSSFLALLSAVTLFNIRFFAPIIGYNGFPEHGLIVDTITSVGCLILIYYAIFSTKLTPLFSNKYLKYIGKISYLLYILHFPILLTTVSIIYPISHSVFLSLFVGFVVTLIASSALYVIIEKPFSKFGVYISKKVSTILHI